MPKVMKAKETKVLKTFRIRPETVSDIEKLQELTGLSQRDVLEEAIKLLKKKKELK